VFDFESLVNITAISFHCNNAFQIGQARVFARAKIVFATARDQLERGAATDYEYLEDSVSGECCPHSYRGSLSFVGLLESSRWVSIFTASAIGRFVKVSLTFADRYLLLSEVRFHTATGESRSQLCVYFKSSF